MAWRGRGLQGWSLALITLVCCLWLGQGQAGRAEPPATITVAQTNAPPPALAPALPMISGNFEDPQGRFQIGIFDGYRVSTAGASPLFEAPDGSLAYTVAITPLATGINQASDTDLVSAAQRTFGRGESFTVGDIQPIPGGGIRINWTGQLSQGAALPQPITGKIFARQVNSDAFLLLVAATEAGESQLSDAIIALGSTLIAS